MKTQQRFSFHRFGDSVAFHSDDTPTLYVSSDIARRVANQLLLFADDCDATPFTQSTLSQNVISEGDYE